MIKKQYINIKIGNKAAQRRQASATGRAVIAASDDFYSLFLAGAAGAVNEAMVTGDPPGPPANKIAAERLGLAYPFDGTSQKVPSPQPSPRERGEGGGPLTHPRCATRQAHARVRREWPEGEGQQAADFNRFPAQNR
jgi:hypothetical protein